MATCIPGALVIAYGVHESGRRELIGLDSGEMETETSWVACLRSLGERDLTGVRLYISDDHTGLRNAIARTLACPWQRCTVHFVRDMHRRRRPVQQGMVSAALREILYAEDPTAARERCGRVMERLAGPVPKVTEPLADAEEDLLAFCAFPAVHWSKLRSTDPLQRVDREIGRRADVVGIFTISPRSGYRAPCSSSRTTSGWSAVAACPRDPWRSCSRIARPTRRR